MGPRVLSPEAARRQRDAIRRMSGSERAELACAMTNLTSAKAVAEIQRRLPALSVQEARHVMLRETLGPELHQAAFPAWNATLAAIEARSPLGFDVRVVLEQTAEEAEGALLPTC